MQAGGSDMKSGKRAMVVRRDLSGVERPFDSMQSSWLSTQVLKYSCLVECFPGSRRRSHSHGDFQNHRSLFTQPPSCPSPSATTKHTQVAIIPSLSSYMPLKGSYGTSRPVEGVFGVSAASLRRSETFPQNRHDPGTD